jgi:hypothetical protein
MLSVRSLSGADEAETRVAEGDAVVRIPTAQEGARHLAWHGADAGTRINPAWRHKIDPGLAVALAHEFDLHPADAVGEIVKGGGSDGIGHAPQSELVQAREEFFVVLVPEQPKHPLGRVVAAATADERQN